MTQSIEESGNLNNVNDYITEKNTDDYIVGLKKGNSNILVISLRHNMGRLEFVVDL